MRLLADDKAGGGLLGRNAPVIYVYGASNGQGGGGDFGVRDEQEEERVSAAAGSSGFDVARVPAPAQRVGFGTGLLNTYSDVARYQHHFKDLV
jgi:hypothetical protein